MTKQNLETLDFSREISLISWHLDQVTNSLNRIMIPLESALDQIQTEGPLSPNVTLSIAETAQMLANFQSWLASQSVMLSDIQVGNAFVNNLNAELAK